MHGQCDARPTVTFPAAGHHRTLTGTKLYCLVTEAHVCEQLAQGCCLIVKRPGVEPATFCVTSQHPSHYITKPQSTRKIFQRKNSRSFSGFSKAINLRFHRLSQWKVNVITTFIKGHSTSTPAVYIYWAGSLLHEIVMILFTQSAAVLHKYFNDKPPSRP